MIFKLYCWWQSFRCWLFYHDLRVHTEYDRATRRVRCMRCKSDWIMSDRHKAFLPWDGEWEAFCEEHYPSVTGKAPRRLLKQEQPQ